MSNTYQIYLISDSTGETLDRIFLALKAQFKNIEYKVHSYSFTRTENQILKILEDAKKNENSVILYTIVDNNLAKYLANTSDEKKIPCFGVLGNLILNFSKILNQKASHEPSGQHVLNDEYYERIEAIQFTMSHDDGNLLDDIENSDIILVGVSRTSKTPTSIYLANKGFKTSNIPLVNENSLPKKLRENPQITCVVGLNTEPERLVDLRKNRMNSLKETEYIKYTNIENIKKEIDDAKKTFRKYKWPSIDVTRKSVEETAASIIKIHEIYLNNVKETLIKDSAPPEIISKNLAELKANKISSTERDKLVLGADSVIDLNGELISKPDSREEALEILKKLNGNKHNLISSVCISRNGSMVWNYTDKAELTMKKLSEQDLKVYLSKIPDETLYAYNVYQIEGEGRNLFLNIDGDEDTIMGLPVFKIKEYLKNY